MKIRGVVIDCNSEVITVKCSKRDACGSCQNSQKCGASSFYKLLLSGNSEILYLANKEHLEFKQFQFVVLELSDKYILKKSLSVYLLSIVISITVAIAVSCFTGNELIILTAFMATIVATLYGIRKISQNNLQQYIKIVPNCC